jgi:hypothetical protein
VTQPNEFSRRLSAHLDQGLQQLDASTEQRLNAMRRHALAERQITHAPQAVSLAIAAWTHKHARMGLALATALIMAGWWFLQPTNPPYSAETDILLLTGELPPNVYADNTFSQWLDARATF